MKFKLNIRLTEKDYLDFNTFWMLKSPYGRKQITKGRVAITAVFAVGILIVLLMGNITTLTYITIANLLFLCAVFHIFMSRFYIWSIKAQIKTMKKSGKMPFSAESLMEFGDESFIETTSENRSEHKYSAIERVSILGGKIIYIHINNIMAYLLPFDSFESVDEYNGFIEFIKTKVNIVDLY